MKLTLTILILIFCISIWAQPAYLKQSYNIDDLPKEYAILHKQSPDLYRLTIVVDSTSKKLSKLRLLKNHTKLTFDIRIETLPKQFNSINFDSIDKVEFLCNGITRDLSNITGFKQAKEIIIKEFDGEKIPTTLKEFQNLEDLYLNDSKNIRNIDALINLRSLKLLSIDCSKLNKFPTFSRTNPLVHIILHGAHDNLDFENLNSIKDLGGIELIIPVRLKEFPDYLTKNLNQIKINGNILSVSNLALYPNLEYIQIKSTQLKKLDVDFKGNTRLKNIGIENNPKLENIDAVYTCKSLEFLSLNGLPSLKEFELRELNMKQGLSIQDTGIRTVKPVEKLSGLSYLYIRHNDYLKIDMKSSGPNSEIFDNGRLLNE